MAKAKNPKLQEFVLEGEQIEQLRRVLLVGLAAFGEVERLQNAAELREGCNQEVPEDLRVVHPSGCADTVGQFADALRTLEYARQVD